MSLFKAWVLACQSACSHYSRDWWEQKLVNRNGRQDTFITRLLQRRGGTRELKESGHNTPAETKITWGFSMKIRSLNWWCMTPTAATNLGSVHYHLCVCSSEGGGCHSLVHKWGCDRLLWVFFPANIALSYILHWHSGGKEKREEKEGGQEEEGKHVERVEKGCQRGSGQNKKAPMTDNCKQRQRKFKIEQAYRRRRAT